MNLFESLGICHADFDDMYCIVIICMHYIIDQTIVLPQPGVSNDNNDDTTFLLSLRLKTTGARQAQWTIFETVRLSSRIVINIC